MPIMHFSMFRRRKEVVERLFEKIQKIKGTTMLNGYAHIPLKKTLFNVGQ